jgi:FeS assembly SUF system protein
MNGQAGSRRRQPLGVLNQEVIPQHPAPAKPPDTFLLEGPGLAPADISSEELEARAILALKTVQDPEIPLNIYDLGLIYAVRVSADQRLHVTMTLTAPGCPVAEQIIREVHQKLVEVPGAREVTTELAWEPAWTQERMSEAAKLQLGLL